MMGRRSSLALDLLENQGPDITYKAKHEIRDEGLEICYSRKHMIIFSIQQLN